MLNKQIEMYGKMTTEKNKKKITTHKEENALQFKE